MHFLCLIGCMAHAWAKRVCVKRCNFEFYVHCNPWIYLFAIHQLSNNILDISMLGENAWGGYELQLSNALTVFFVGQINS